MQPEPTVREQTMNSDQEAGQGQQDKSGMNDEGENHPGVHKQKSASGEKQEFPGNGPDLVSTATIALAVCTFALACVTTWLAFETRDMATSTRVIAKAAEEQGHDFKTSLEIARDQVKTSVTQAQASVEANAIAKDTLTRSERPKLFASIAPDISPAIPYTGLPELKKADNGSKQFGYPDLTVEARPLLNQSSVWKALQR